MPAKLKDKGVKRDARTIAPEKKNGSALPRPIKRHKRKGPLTALIGAGAGSFKTTEDADNYLRRLRDEWDK